MTWVRRHMVALITGVLIAVVLTAVNEWRYR